MLFDFSLWTLLVAAEVAWLKLLWEGANYAF
jgi:hypothetical protein